MASAPEDGVKVKQNHYGAKISTETFRHGLSPAAGVFLHTETTGKLPSAASCLHLAGGSNKAVMMKVTF